MIKIYSQAIVIALFFWWIIGDVQASKPGDVVYLCYETKDGNRKTAKATLVNNETEEHELVLLESTNNWRNSQGDKQVGSLIGAHEAELASNRESCKPSPSPESIKESRIVECRVQRGGVLQNYKILDQEECKKVIEGCMEKDGKTVCKITYIWPSGSKTIVEFSDKFYAKILRINGSKALFPNAIADHNCILNTRSNNLFCAD